MKSFSESYKAAGVDVVAGYQAVELMKEHVKKTRVPGMMSAIGGFGGLFEMDLEKYPHPVLVSGTDGVGTKLKIAFLMDKHDTVGQDCVAMCVNDVICCGAKPLFFLDYIACGKNVPEKIATIVKGVADGCVKGDCGLVGGETAEMPGFYPVDEYDLAGFTVGVVNKEDIIDGTKLAEGDVIVGLASSGVHSNGFSLVRKILDLNEEKVKEYREELGTTLGEALLAPTKIYVRPMLDVISQVQVKAISHITGGGFYENIPRMLQDGYKAVIHKNKVDVLPIFRLLQKEGNVPERDMFNTFNMGIGMMFAVAKEDAQKAIDICAQHGEKATVIGEIVRGEKEVEIV